MSMFGLESGDNCNEHFLYYCIGCQVNIKNQIIKRIVLIDIVVLLNITRLRIDITLIK
jgi:hypothetical protein